MKMQKKIPNKISYIRRIDATVLGIVFAMLIVLLVGISSTVEHYKASQLDRVQETMDVVSESYREQFEDYINQKVDVLQGLTAFTEINSMVENKQKSFLKGRSRELGFHHLFIMDMNGMGYYFDEGVTRDQSGEQFFSDVKNHRVYITQPFYGADGAYMTVCVSILNMSREKVGALCGAVELKSIQSEFSESKAVYGGQMYLVDRTGKYISCSNMEKVYNQKIIYDEKNSDWSIVKNAFDDEIDKKGTVVINGIEYQANVTYLETYDWVIIQCVDKSVVYGALKVVDTLKYIAIIIIVIIVICVVRIALYLRRSQMRISTDTLTGCNSRAAMESLLEKMEKATESVITVTYMDLNKFKTINDTYGHDKGDEILCIFTRVLKKVFHRKGYVGRMGGDEFMILLVDTSDEEVKGMCEEVGELLIKESQHLGFDYTISASYGYASREKGSTESLDNIIVKADERMYRYKEEHRKTN